MDRAARLDLDLMAKFDSELPTDRRQAISDFRSQMPDDMRLMFDIGRLVEKTNEALDEHEQWKARRTESVGTPVRPAVEQEDRIIHETLDAFDNRGVKKKQLVRYLFGAADRRANLDEIVRDLYGVNLKDSRVQRVEKARRAARKLVNRAIEDTAKLNTPLALMRKRNLVIIEYRTSEGQNLDV